MCVCVSCSASVNRRTYKDKCVLVSDLCWRLSKLATRKAVNLPPTCLQWPGEPAILFSTKIQMFENYLLAVHAEGDDWSDTKKHATLLHCLTTEAQWIFYTLPNMGTTYTSALTALRAHFVPQVNTIAEHHKESKGMMRTFCKTWPRSGIWCLLVHLVTKKRKCSEIKSFEKVHSCQFLFFCLFIAWSRFNFGQSYTNHKSAWMCNGQW